MKKMLNVISHQEHANQNHKPTRTTATRRLIVRVGEDMGKLEPSYTAG